MKAKKRKNKIKLIFSYPNDEAICLGGSEVRLKEGFWKSGPLSTLIYKCTTALHSDPAQVDLPIYAVLNTRGANALTVMKEIQS